MQQMNFVNISRKKIASYCKRKGGINFSEMHLMAFNTLILKLVFRIFKKLIFFHEVDVKNVSAIVKKLIGIILI